MSNFEIDPSDYLPKIVIYNHPDWKYHSAPGLSSSAVKCFVNQSPRHYQFHYLEKRQDRKETDAMLLGTLVHCLVLEPDDFEKRYEQALQQEDFTGVMKTIPELKKYCEQNTLPTNGVKQDLINRVIEHDHNALVWDVMLNRQRHSKKRIINSGLWDKARYMRDGVFDNPDASSLFSTGRSEVSVWAEHEATGQLIKCRSDWLRPDGICADLKTCGCSSPEAFSKDCARFGYHLQEVHYTTVLQEAGIDCTFFPFVAVENEPPYLCQVYTLDEHSRQLARQRYEAAMKQLAQCTERNEWPGYADPVSLLSLPGWNLKQLENVA